MKARVKATGEIVSADAMVSFNGDDFYLDELELIQDDTEKTLYDELDDVYWANMKHQYAGMAMQGILSNPNIAHKDVSREELIEYWTEHAVTIATALVNKLKGE